MAAFTRQILIDVTNEILSPSWQLRNAAVFSMHHAARLSMNLITSLRWTDVVHHSPPSQLVVSSPDVQVLQLPAESVPAVSAWMTFSAERGLRDPDNRMFPTIRNHRYVPAEPMTDYETRASEAWFWDYIADPTYQDYRDVAALCLGRVRGRRGLNPATIAQTRWQDLTEFDFRLGNEDHHPRVSLFEVLDEWGCLLYTSPSPRDS